MKTMLCRYTQTPEGEEQHTISQYRLSPALTVSLQRRKRSRFLWATRWRGWLACKGHNNMRSLSLYMTEPQPAQWMLTFRGNWRDHLKPQPGHTPTSHAHSMRGKMGSMWGKGEGLSKHRWIYTNLKIRYCDTTVHENVCSGCIVILR